MQARRTIGVAAAALGVAAVATFLTMPSVVAAGPQDKPADKKVDQQIEKQTVTIQKAGSGEPMTVTVQRVDGQEPNIVVRRSMTPALTSVFEGGPRLGVEIRDVAQDDVAKLKLASQTGVAVIGVLKESAAEKAGLKANDVVVQFDGEHVRSAQQLTRLVRETVPGRTVKMAVMRDGKRMDLDVTPAEPKDEARVFVNEDQIRGDVEREKQGLRDDMRQFHFERRMPGPGAGGNFMWFGDGAAGPLEMHLSQGRGRLGVRVQELTPDLAAYFGVKAGVLVASVDADTPAVKAGIKAGDVITAVNEKAVTSASELVEQLEDKQGEVTIAVTRDKKPLPLKAMLDAPRTPQKRVIMRGSPA